MTINYLNQPTYAVMMEYDLDGTLYCITIGRYGLYINTPSKIYIGKPAPLYYNKFLKEINIR